MTKQIWQLLTELPRLVKDTFDFFNTVLLLPFACAQFKAWENNMIEELSAQGLVRTSKLETVRKRLAASFPKSSQNFSSLWKIGNAQLSLSNKLGWAGPEFLLACKHLANSAEHCKRSYKEDEAPFLVGARFTWRP